MFGKMLPMAIAVVLVAGSAAWAQSPAEEARRLEGDLARLRAQLRQTELRLTRLQESLRSQAPWGPRERVEDSRTNPLVERMRNRGMSEEQIRATLEKMRAAGFNPPAGGVMGFGSGGTMGGGIGRFAPPAGGRGGPARSGGFGSTGAGGGTVTGPPGGFAGASRSATGASGFGGGTGFAPAGTFGRPPSANPNEGIEQRLDKIAKQLEELTRELRTLRQRPSRGS